MKIYGTIGPSCLDVDILKEMFDQGMTGIRLNLSHISLTEAEDMIAIYHKAAAKAGVHHPELLIDMQGPEIRIGSLDHPLSLTEGERVIIGQGGIPVPENIFPYLEEGQSLLLDDGKILLQVAQSDAANGEESKRKDREISLVCHKNAGKSGICRVVRAGILDSKKSLALPGKNIPSPALTIQDQENLKEAKNYGVTAIMQPFVRSREDLLCVREAMKAASCQDLTLLAKIENQYGVDHLSDFMDLADEIVIARGDLGNAMPLWELPGVQRKISQRCLEKKKPFMVVTQMLSSMERNPLPTRAEVSDIYYAAFGGANSVMVTGETAIGSYPVEVIRYLTQTALRGCEDRLMAQTALKGCEDRLIFSCMTEA